MPKPKQPDDAKGIYQRKGTANYWLRYTVDGEQVQISLGTSDYKTAVEKAKLERGKKTWERKPDTTPWSAAVDKYLKDKLAGKKHGKIIPGTGMEEPCRKFDPKVAEDTRSVLIQAATIMNVSLPSETTIKHLYDYYEHWRTPGPKTVSARRKEKVYIRKFKVPRPTKSNAPPAMRSGSEATAQTLTNRLQAFLDHINCLPGRVIFDEESEVENRDVVVPEDEIQKLLRTCPRQDVLFVLLMGFRHGLRRAEIVSVRPSWIRLSEGKIVVPGEEIQELANGKQRLWRTKNRKPREIPIAPELRDFLSENHELLNPKRLFVLHPEACGRRYRWDPRRPFADMVSHLPGVTLHTMRHTFITWLVEKKYSLGDVATYSGDKLETIDKHYFHGKAKKGGLDQAFPGRKGPISYGDGTEAPPEQRAIEEEYYAHQADLREDERSRKLWNELGIRS